MLKEVFTHRRLSVAYETMKEFCAELGVSISDAEKKLYDIKPNDGHYFNEGDSKSGYLVPLYFSAVSLIMENITNVLELGTGTGNITNLLANLFPASIVYTIDLPADDKDYEKLAHRSRSEKDMMEFRKNIDKNNIKYFEINSFFLPSLALPKKFDLIFVDGGHRYPVVAWDVMFAYNHLRSDGFVFFHDYNGGKRHITETIKYMKNIIDEKIGIVWHSTECGQLAWLRKI